MKVVILNGLGTTSQTFGVFGGNLQQAKEKFLAICEESGAEMEPDDVVEENNRVCIELYCDNKVLWNILNKVTRETECGGDPPDRYMLVEIEVEENEYKATGAFND